jgi:hypothetical protein
LLPGMNMAGIHNLSERISRSVSTSPVKHGENRTSVTISIGGAAPEIRRDIRLDDLLSEAAQHLSLARSLGGNQAVIAEPVNDAAESCTTDITGTATLSAEAIMEMVSGTNTTEIDIGIPLALEPEENPANKLPKIECRETADTAPLPSMFAGPVCDSPRGAQAGAPAGSNPESTSAFDGLVLQEPAVPQGRAVFAFDDMDAGMDETIIITAPFDINSTGTPEKASAVLLENDQPVASDHEIHEEVEEPPLHSGFLRRLLTAIRSPFGRRKPA